MKCVYKLSAFYVFGLTHSYQVVQGAQPITKIRKSGKCEENGETWKKIRENSE